MDSGRLPSELFRSFQILRTVRSTVFGGCATHSVFGSILSTRDPPETPSSGTATSMLPEEHVHVWFFPEALVTFTSTLSDTAKYRPSDSPVKVRCPEVLVTPVAVASGWFTAMSPASVLAMSRHTCASLPVIFDQSTG